MIKNKERKMVDYKIISSSNLTDFSKQCSEAVKDGWEMMVTSLRTETDYGTTGGLAQSSRSTIYYREFAKYK